MNSDSEYEEDMVPYDSDPDENYSDNDGDDGAGAESEDDDMMMTLRPQKTYTVLEESDIQQRQEEEISHVSATLVVSKEVASVLLCHYKWNVFWLHDEWFADEEGVRAKFGLLGSGKPGAHAQSSDHTTGSTCGICFDCYPVDQIYTTVCGHPYCATCWKCYINISINDGPGCLSLMCPEPSCRAAVGRDMIEALASETEKRKYSRYFLRTYVEEKKTIKWCPGPGCDNAVEFELGSSVYHVTCLCSHTFCWNCTEDAHRPVDCDTVLKWVQKNRSEAENTEWIITNSKPCPKCKRPIEKNHGCMHMTCSAPCTYQFCWLCLGSWKDHDTRSSGFYACNRYQTEKNKGMHSKDERRRETAKNSLGRYTHHYERWASNQQSRQKATEALHKTQTDHLQKLSDRVKIPISQLKFIIDAWQQIIECRRVLKWTYAYGFYLPEQQNAKRHLFEYLQGQAESELERLHHCVETELLRDFLGEHEPGDFNAFHSKLCDLTKVTNTFFENLVGGLENGLSEAKAEL